MKFLNLLIETNENYKETTLFPWITPTQNKVIIKYDAIPIKYLDKLYVVTLQFPFKYDNLLLQDNESESQYKVDLIHSSYELNLFLFSCSDYDLTQNVCYNINDLKYKIPKENFESFFISNEDTSMIIKHLDYYFYNSNAPNLPPQAYIKCYSDQSNIGSILFNPQIYGIYGIQLTTTDANIFISSLSIKRLLDGINTEFKYSNFYCDYRLFSTKIISGINILTTQYKNININETILDVNNLMIIRGNIKYKKIDEYVPIEVYLWYEWLPNTSIILNTFDKGNYYKKQLKFIDYNEMLKIPIKHIQSDSKIMSLSFQLLKYLYDKNIVLKDKKIERMLLNPYELHENLVDVSEEIILNKFEEPTEMNINIIIKMD